MTKQKEMEKNILHTILWYKNMWFVFLLKFTSSNPPNNRYTKRQAYISPLY